MGFKKSYSLVFTGTGHEYFRIWIVNIALTIITFGIYSAWAKVRTNRWFYGHTSLDNSSFSYLASPMQILKGRIIAILLLVAYVIINELNSIAGLIVLIMLMVASPWIILFSLRFAAQQTSYRAIRFSFLGTVGEALKVYLLFPIIGMISVGLLMPYAAYRQVQFMASNFEYGDTKTSYNGSLDTFIHLYLMAFLFLLVPLGSMIYGGYVATQMHLDSATMSDIIFPVIKWSLGGLIVFYLSIPFVAMFILARTTNLFYNHTRLGEVNFVSTLRARDLVWIHFSNFILIFLTLGLYIPYAQVRLARYKVERLSVFSEDFEIFIAKSSSSSQNSIGSEISDIFDMNIGIG